MKTIIRHLRYLFTTATMLLYGIIMRAQDDFDDIIVSDNRRGSDSDGLDGLNLLEDEERTLHLSDYTDEIIVLFLLFLAIGITRHFVSKRDRKGCTFFIIIFAAIAYACIKLL